MKALGSLKHFIPVCLPLLVNNRYFGLYAFFEYRYILQISHLMVY